MHIQDSLLRLTLLLAAATVQAASSWGFDEGTVAVTAKTATTAATTESFNAKSPLSKVVAVGAQDTVTISLTAKDNGKAKRPHQAFLLLKDVITGVEAPFPLAVRESGKGKVSIAQKDIPIQLLASSKPIEATVVIGSFGSAQGLVSSVFKVSFTTDPSATTPTYTAPERYGRKPVIHHIFRTPDKTPPRVISLAFTLLVVACLPVLFIGWIGLGANLKHLPKALSAAPVSHAAFFGSIAGIEGVYFAFHAGYNLFQVLPPLIGLGVVAVLSGTRALGEVQSRRFAGER